MSTCTSESLQKTSKCRILFVCTGNICRSPTAEGIFRQLLIKQNLTEKIEVDSAGTSAFHANDPADERSQKVAKAHGYDISNLRSRQLSAYDCDNFDYFVAMTNNHVQAMQNLCRKYPKANGEPLRIVKLLDYINEDYANANKLSIGDG